MNTLSVTTSSGGGGTRTITNDSTEHAVTLGNVFRNFGDVTLNFDGPGTINMPSIFGSGGATPVMTVNKNGAGHLDLTGAGGGENIRGFNLNDGSLFVGGVDFVVGGKGDEASDFTWNGGVLQFALSNDDDSSNFFQITGGLLKGSGETFAIDFQNTGIQETYTLLAFENTTFDLSDFTALNSPQPGTFSFGTTEINDVTYDTLLYTIPEPRVYAALFGLLALGFVVWRRRR